MTNLDIPAGARAGVCQLLPQSPHAWAEAYSNLIHRARAEVRAQLPNFEPIARWRGCHHRILLRNPYADIGLIVGHGSAAIWLGRRDDTEFLRHTQPEERNRAADAWLATIAPRFDIVLQKLNCRSLSDALPLAA